MNNRESLLIVLNLCMVGISASKCTNKQINTTNTILPVMSARAVMQVNF
jgi:hypothetical protein